MSRVMVTFGSGGHSTEMLMLLKNAKVAEKLTKDRGHPPIGKLICVISDDDAFIQDKLRDEYQDNYDKFDIVKIKRPRAIKQSYLTTIWTFLTVLHTSFHIIEQKRPNLFLTNGPGLSVTLALALKLVQLTNWSYTCRILYVESFCRTRTLSLTGKLLYHLRLANDIYVQWPEIADKYPRVKYGGILV